jgi:hypothetical protein
MIICRGANGHTNGQIFTSLFRDKLSLQGARIDPALCVYHGAHLICIDNKHLNCKIQGVPAHYAEY